MIYVPGQTVKFRWSYNGLEPKQEISGEFIEEWSGRLALVKVVDSEMRTHTFHVSMDDFI